MAATLIAVLLAGILGMVGQGARAVVGLDTRDLNVHNPEAFSAARLAVSLVIGFIAGVLSALALGILNTAASGALDRPTMLGLMAAGYAGTDVIEGLMAKYLPQSNAPSPAGTVTPPASAAGAQTVPPATVTPPTGSQGAASPPPSPTAVGNTPAQPNAGLQFMPLVSAAHGEVWP